MESRHNISRAIRHDSTSFQNQAFENTNPFQSQSGSVSQLQSAAKPGKRPRIMKPLYSARLS